MGGEVGHGKGCACEYVEHPANASFGLHTVCCCLFNPFGGTHGHCNPFEYILTLISINGAAAVKQGISAPGSVKNVTSPGPHQVQDEAVAGFQEERFPVFTLGIPPAGRPARVKRA